MPEQHNIEWKVTWKDDYLKWICGFANAQGGRIYIGIDDNGTIVGLKSEQRLMEDIPNKIQTILGIMPDVNLLEYEGKHYIEINIAPCSTPINYKGEYHYRCGSTKQILKGNALNDFLLRKNGLSWDDITEPAFSIDSLDQESFDIFTQEAVRSGRMTSEDLQLSRRELLDHLGLLSKGCLKRAGVLLFHRHPEKLAQSCYIKIGKFSNECDLLFQDEVRGSLFSLAHKVIDLLYLKYLTASISYDKDTRIERYPYPRTAIREVIFNALIHSNWGDYVPIHIRVDEHSLSISNACVLPLGWNEHTLTERHKSRPFNPNVAHAFFRAGMVETWGRGISKVQQACRLHGIAEPSFKLVGNDLTVIFTQSLQVSALTPEVSEFTPEVSKLTPEVSEFTPEVSEFTPEVSKLTPEVSEFTPEVSEFTPEVSEFTPEVSGLSTKVPRNHATRMAILKICQCSWKTTSQMAEILGLDKRSLRRILNKMLQDGTLQMRYPGIDNHPQQAYRTME